LEQHYDLVGKIGEGTYGVVYLATAKQDRTQMFAIKKFKTGRVSFDSTALQALVGVSPALQALVGAFLLVRCACRCRATAVFDEVSSSRSITESAAASCLPCCPLSLSLHVAHLSYHASLLDAITWLVTASSCSWRRSLQALQALRASPSSVAHSSFHALAHTHAHAPTHTPMRMH
jgi:hypothetical protein